MREPSWIEEPEILAIHELQLAEHGGATGLRDVGLLKSAIARPRQVFAHEDPDLAALATSYTAGIIRNHPFVDGSKRVGFVVGVLFLEMNGLNFGAPESEAARAVLDLAARSLDEEEYAEWLRSRL